MNKQSVFFDTYNMHCWKLLFFERNRGRGSNAPLLCVCLYVRIDDAKMLQNIVLYVWIYSRMIRLPIHSCHIIRPIFFYLLSIEWLLLFQACPKERREKKTTNQHRRNKTPNMKFGIQLLLFVINRDNNYDSVGVDILNFDSMRDLIFGWYLAIKMVTHQEKIHSVGMCMRECARFVATMYVCMGSNLPS